MCTAADITFSLLTSGFVLSPSLFFPWIQFVLPVQFVLWVRLLLDRSWLATVCDVSSGTHHMINPSRPSPRFSYCKQQKLGVEAWERGYCPLLGSCWPLTISHNSSSYFAHMHHASIQKWLESEELKNDRGNCMTICQCHLSLLSDSQFLRWSQWTPISSDIVTMLLATAQWRLPVAHVNNDS